MPPIYVIFLLINTSFLILFLAVYRQGERVIISLDMIYPIIIETFPLSILIEVIRGVINIFLYQIYMTWGNLVIRVVWLKTFVFVFSWKFTFVLEKSSENFNFRQLVHLVSWIQWYTVKADSTSFKNKTEDMREKNQNWNNYKQKPSTYSNTYILYVKWIT